MALTREQKGGIITELTNQIKSAKTVVFADYQGLTVKDMKTLKSELRSKGIPFKVTKKTFIKLAAKEAGYSEIPNENMEGPVGAAFGIEDEILAAKIIYNYSKKNQNLKLRGALFDGKVLSVAETKSLAMLPSKEELLSKLVYLLNSPISGFASVLSNTISGFVRVINAIKDKKGQTA